MSELFAENYFYELVLDSKKKLRKRKSVIHTLKGIPKFVFICGKQIRDENTGKIHEEERLIKEKNKRYLIKKDLIEYKVPIDGFTQDRNVVLPVLSEELYNGKSEAILDLLTFEKILCKLSDEVLLIIESDGTKCELGAFAADDDLAKKLCIINDIEYENTNSFISQGPIRKVKEITGPIIHVNYSDFDRFLSNLSIKQYLDKIKAKKVEYIPNINGNALDVKNLIYELLAIFELFEPLTESEIVYLYKEYKDIHHYSIDKDYKSKFTTIESVLRFMHEIELLDNQDDLYFLNAKYKFLCVNTLFSFDEKSFNELRDDYKNLLKLSLPNRLAVLPC